MQSDASDEMEAKGSSGGSVLGDIVACILPLVSLVAALGLAVLVFRRVDAAVTGAQEALATASASQDEMEAVEQQVVYAGVQDRWIEAGTFTVGSEDLDAYIRDFCDEHTRETDTVDEAAQATYDAIVTSTYLYRVDKPMGLDWVARSAREYFTSDDGMGGHQGDVYEFASVLALCLRYFGYGDAIAVPIVDAQAVSDTEGSALCLVTDSDGLLCVCDPSVGTAGWMLPRSSYQILVDDIGQNLDAAEALGLEIKKKYDDEDEETTGEDGSGTTATSGTSTSSGRISDTSGSGVSGLSTYDEYDDDIYGDYGGYDAYDEYGMSNDAY